MMAAMRRSQIQSTPKRTSENGQTGHTSKRGDARVRTWHRPTMRKLPVGRTASGGGSTTDATSSLAS